MTAHPAPHRPTEATSTASDPALPRVSVVMPILNEERHLEAAVRQVLGQDWSGPLEVVLALGPSTDGTDDVAGRLADEDSRVVLVANPTGRTPDALNAAVAGSTGAVVVRVDGHAEIPGDYVSTAVAVLDETGADTVGGTMDARGTTPFERAVACAMRSRLGVGGGRFHTGGAAGPVDTVYLGAFRRSALDRVGGYDTRFTRAQDWELNHRIRATGGVVWFSPRLRVTYRPRASVRALSRQYRQYGRWRRAVSRAHAGTLTARYLAAPTMVVGVTAATALAPWWWPAVLVPLGYLAGVVVGGVVIGRGEPGAARVLTPVALATMHWSWGVGFLASPRALGRALGSPVQ
ncbi:MAG: glycosyltransferase family 2 protein [Dermatophilaceae bacterium]